VSNIKTPADKPKPRRVFSELDERYKLLGALDMAKAFILRIDGSIASEGIDAANLQRARYCVMEALNIIDDVQD